MPGFACSVGRDLLFALSSAGVSQPLQSLVNMRQSPITGQFVFDGIAELSRGKTGVLLQFDDYQIRLGKPATKLFGD